MALLVTVLALMASGPDETSSEFAPADGQRVAGTLQYRTAQRERAVHTARTRPPKRVRAGLRHRARHGHCKTQQCFRSMRRRHRQDVERRWRRITRPYRGWLASTRACESGGRYGINTGNGFYGAYQFTLSSWYAVGGRGYPHNARPLEQDYRAIKLLHVQGRGAWPVCG